MSLEVIGVGLHRTGSLSVKVALERLGFGPGYHGFEYLGRPDHVPLWQEAIDNDGDIEWDRIFGGYQTAFDWPMLYFWEKVVAAHPDARIVLTVRDPETWYESHAALLPALMEKLDEGELPVAPASLDQQLLDATFPGGLFERDHCIDVFHRHAGRVCTTVPPQRLLLYRVTEGWEPLCRFLGVDVPDEPFPRVNARAVMMDNTLSSVRRTELVNDGRLVTLWRRSTSNPPCRVHRHVVSSAGTLPRSRSLSR
jgi:hypothetical protein